MDKSVAKWLVRAGSLLIVLGFFLPSVAVSCSVLGATQSQSFSMNDLATGTANQSLLYLVLLGAIASMIVAFISPRDNQQRILFLWGQMTGLGLGLLSIFVVILSLSAQMQQIGMKTGVDVGFFVLLFGYGLGGGGIIMQFLQPGQTTSSPVYRGAAPEPDPASAQAGYSPPPRPVSGARLELVRGNAPSPVFIQTTDFQLGRSSRNHLVLSDHQASGLHARLRFAQGAWFIQDQDSSNGTFVNGKRITAQRLNDRDQIRVGEITYIFRI
jgi:hypothetical protein